MNNETTPAVSAVSAETKNLAVLMWVGTIILSFIPGLVFYLIKKDDQYLFDQAKEALNWSITTVIGYCAGIALMFILIGGLVMAAVLICNLVFCVMGAIAASKGENFRAPFALRLIN